MKVNFLICCVILTIALPSRVFAQDYRGIASNHFGQWSSATGRHPEAVRRIARQDCENYRGLPCQITTVGYIDDFFILIHCRNDNYQNSFALSSSISGFAVYKKAINVAESRGGFYISDCRIIKEWE